MNMKRSVTEMIDLDHSLTMANCLMLLSRSSGSGGGGNDHQYGSFSLSPSKVFECKTCNRQFPSFQALGGHRASHKKPRFAGLGDSSSNNSEQSQSQGSPPKPKTHECNVCGLEFAIGQALGGHMRRHRAALNGGGGGASVIDHNRHKNSDDNDNNDNQYSNNSLSLNPQPAQVLQVLKKTNSGRRVMCLDLNLTPLENDLEILQLGKQAPLVSFF